jgi:hypothetical protein
MKGLRYARENKAGTIPILLRYMKIKEDLAGQYYDQVRPIMTASDKIWPIFFSPPLPFG